MPLKPQLADKLRRVCEMCRRTHDELITPAKDAGLDVSAAEAHNAKQLALAEGILRAEQFWPAKKTGDGVA